MPKGFKGAPCYFRQERMKWGRASYTLPEGFPSSFPSIIHVLLRYNNRCQPKISQPQGIFLISLNCIFLKTQPTWLVFYLARNKNAYGQKKIKEVQVKAVTQISYDNQQKELPLDICHAWFLSVWRNMSNSYLLQHLFSMATVFHDGSWIYYPTKLCSCLPHCQNCSSSTDRWIHGTDWSTYSHHHYIKWSLIFVYLLAQKKKKYILAIKKNQNWESNEKKVGWFRPIVSKRN